MWISRIWSFLIRKKIIRVPWGGETVVLTMHQRFTKGFYIELAAFSDSIYDRGNVQRWWLLCRVARFFMVQYNTKTGKYTKWTQNIPNEHKIHIPNEHKIYQMSTKYTQWAQYVPKCHKIYQHLPMQDPSKFIQLRFLVGNYTTIWQPWLWTWTIWVNAPSVVLSSDHVANALLSSYSVFRHKKSLSYFWSIMMIDQYPDPSNQISDIYQISCII
jgi:hypothetical protein